MIPLFQFLLGTSLLPFFGLAWILILIIRLLQGLKKARLEIHGEALPQSVEPRASIIILNWNGRRLLEENLPSVTEAVWSDHSEHEIIVVDNGSEDDSVLFVRAQYPNIRVLALPGNLGFSKGNNYGVQQARYPFVVLLNNDMGVTPGFLRPLLAGFTQNVFAVSSQIDFSDPAKKREETGKTAACFYRGQFTFSHQVVQQWDQKRGYVPIFWAGGGSSAFDRDKFLALGGFRELYSPCYVEDTDLSFRAWKRGWRVLMAPSSRVYHEHRASSKRRFHPRQLEVLILRNQLLFSWTNLYDWPNLMAYGFYFPIIWIRTLLGRGSEFWKSLAGALASLPKVILLRCHEPPPILADRQIFQGIRERYRSYYPSRSGKAGNTSQSLRILMVTAYLPHLGYHAGAGRMFHLIRRLARHHQVSLLTFVENREEIPRAEPLREFCSSVRTVLRDPDYIKSLYIYEPFDAFFSTPFREALWEEMEREDYDLIHYEYAQMAAYILPACPIPQVLTEHEVNYAACRIQARLRRNWVQKIFWFYNYMQVMQREVRLMRRPDKLICMTPKDAGFFAGLVEDRRLAVIPTGVDLDHYDPRQCRLPEEFGSMVFVGSFNHHPNCEAMLFFCHEVLPAIRKVIPDARLYIVGANPPGEISALATHRQVVVTGFVEDLRPYLTRASIYVVPLRLGVGIRGKILEAWAMERPVIATSLACAGLPAMHGENVWMADSAAEIQSGILKLFADEELRRRLGRSGRRIAEAQFSWDTATDQLEALYRQVQTDSVLKTESVFF